LHVSLLREHRLFLLVFCFVRSHCPPLLFSLLSAGLRSLGEKSHLAGVEGGGGVRFFTLMLLVVTSAPSPGGLPPQHWTSLASLVDTDVLPRYLHFSSPCIPQKCPCLLRHARDALHLQETKENH